MHTHKNARLTPLHRAEMAQAVVEGRLTKAAAARLYKISVKIVVRWVERYKIDPGAGMVDRSSRPKRISRQTQQNTVDRITALARRGMAGKGIAVTVGVSPATVSRVLKRAGLSPPRSKEDRDLLTGAVSRFVARPTARS
jgi:transposase